MQGNLEISGGGGDVTSGEFEDHSAQHENGGTDEISVAGLSGLLADKQTPLPAGSDTQVQFNDAGTQAGDAGLTYDKTTDSLTVSGLLTVNGAGQSSFLGSAANGVVVDVRNTANTGGSYAQITISDNLGGVGSLLVPNTGTTVFPPLFNSGLTVESAGSGGLSLSAADTAGVIRFYTNSSERMRIVSDGGIGIVAAAKLYLDGVASNGDTHIAESSANTITLTAGGTGQLIITSSDATVAGTLSVSGATSRHRNAVEQTTTSTGTQNDFSLTGAYTYLRCNNASALTLTGFTVAGSAPQAGDTVVIDNIGSSTVKVTNQDTGSTEANRVIAPSTNGQIIGATGRLLAVYDGTTDRWRLSVVNTGATVSQAYSAGDFTASGGGTWTVDSGDLGTLKYVVANKVMTVWWDIILTSVSGSPSALQITIPGGYTAADTVYGAHIASDNGTGVVGKCQVAAGTLLYLYKDLVGTAWATATNTTSTQGYFTFVVT